MTSGRELARRVLKRVEEEEFASRALSSELEAARLSDSDRRLATEIVYGVLRHRTRIDRALEAMATRGLKKTAPVVLRALRVAAYQMLFLDRVPDHAAVNDAVAIARRSGGQRVAGFVNGLLRRLGREGEPALPPGDLSVEFSLPEWIVAELARVSSAEEIRDAAAAMNRPAQLAIRANRRRIEPEALVERLASEVPGARIERSSLAEHGLLVGGLGSPSNLPSFREGLWTVQDIGAQLVTHFLGVAPGMRVLDACAGVGGKSTYLAELADDCHIDAADLSEQKLGQLREAAERLGSRGIHPIESDLTHPGSEIAEAYDAILLDAPCTGLGVLRRHPEAKWRVVPEDVVRMAELQRRLLDVLAERLVPGGVLLYCVCTFTAAEGPGQIEAFTNRHEGFEVVDPPGSEPEHWGALIDEHGHLSTWPHRHGADAFFAARLQRRP